jgi:hypothetical protein
MLSSERSTKFSNSVTLHQIFQQLNLVCRQLLIAAYSMISSAPPRKHGKLYFILQLGATRTSSHRKLVFIFEKRCAPIHCRSRSCYLRAVFIAENSVRPHFEQAAQVITAEYIGTLDWGAALNDLSAHGYIQVIHRDFRLGSGA